MSWIEEELNKAYDHIEDYLKDQNELRLMCEKCERYCGSDHAYDECREAPCFRFYLAYVYLNWTKSYEMFPDEMGR